MKHLIQAALAVLCLGVSVAWAHHSFAMFDMKRDVELKGVVKEVQWNNPHVWIELLVPADDGATQQWSVETMGPAVLFGNLHWPRDAMKQGDKVVLHIHPLWSGKHGGSLLYFDGPKGRFYGLPSSDPNLISR